jgi:hypothetical protein
MKAVMKAQFYSIIALVITLPIFIFTVNFLTYSQRISYSVADRVISDQINQLVGSLELDTEKAMEICGRRALLAATNYVIEGGIPLDDASANITTLMLKGTINGTADFMMINNTMPNWSQRISSKPVNFDVTLEYGNVSIESSNGFSLTLGMDLNVTVCDKLQIAKIEKVNLRKLVTISLLGLEDPFFPMNTQGFIRRIIRRASPSHFSLNLVDGSANSSGSCSGDVTFNKSLDDDTKILVAENVTGVVFSRHMGIILEDEENLTGDIDCYLTGNSSAVDIVNGTVTSTGYETVYIDGLTKWAWSMPGAEKLQERYYYPGNGPDFLKRLEGDYTPSANGIVTLIYVPELEEQAFEIDDYSRVAYLYFSGQGGCEKVRNTPEWFGIDSSHADEFNVSDLTTGESCYTWSP